LCTQRPPLSFSLFFFRTQGTTKEHHAFRFGRTDGGMFQATTRPSAPRPGELPHRAQARAHYAAAAAAGPPPADPSRRRRNNNNNGIGGAGGLAYLHGRGVWNWTRDDFASGLHDGAGLAVGQLQGGSGEAPSDPPLVVAVGFQITPQKKKKKRNAPRHLLGWRRTSRAKERKM
jgi:hypothetical protein